MIFKKGDIVRFKADDDLAIVLGKAPSVAGVGRVKVAWITGSLANLHGSYQIANFDLVVAKA